MSESRDSNPGPRRPERRALPTALLSVTGDSSKAGDRATPPQADATPRGCPHQESNLD